MISHFRTPLFARSLCFLAVTSFTTASCSKQEVLPSPKTPTERHPLAGDAYSGEQLFKGIFLLEGEVAAKLPTLQGFRLLLEKQQVKDQAYKAAREKRNVRVTKAVATIAPGYFDELQQAVSSQQFDVIEQVLQKGAQLMNAALIEETSGSANAQAALKSVRSLNVAQYDFSKQEDVEKFTILVNQKKAEFAVDESQEPVSLNQQLEAVDTISIAYAFDIAVAIEVVAVVLIAFVAVIPALPTQETSDSKGDSPSLAHENLIKEIAFNLVP